MPKDYESYRKGNGLKANEPEPYREIEDNERHSFPSMFMDLLRNINWRIAAFLFIVGAFIFSDTFIQIFLMNVGGAVDDECPTTKGTTMQLLAFIVMYIVIDLLAKNKII
jgi:hypothetical protein